MTNLMMPKGFLFVAFFTFITTIPIVSQNSLIIPEIISGNSFSLELQRGSHQFFSGQNTATMGVNGNILGPTLIMEKGSEVDLSVFNNLGETSTIHWHGMHVSAENDGGPHTTIQDGTTWNPGFTVMDEAGTYWYHPHLHEKTNEHVSKGIAGFILVKDEVEAALNLPRTYGIDDFPLAIQTKDFDLNNQIVSEGNSDDVVMVNATIDPILEVPAQIVRFRILNGSSQRVFNLGLSDNMSFYQIASDGGLLAQSIAITRLMLAPGERAEILIDFSNKEGQAVNLKSYASELQNGIYGAENPGTMNMMTLDGYKPNSLNGNDFNILELKAISATANPVVSVPNELVSIKPFQESSANAFRSLTFFPQTMGPNQLNGHFLINGRTFDMGVIDYSIPLNNIEVWTINNQTAIAHPFHIHDVQFFVLDRNGLTPLKSEQGRKDVILVKAMETVRIITKFEDFANEEVPYMFHCHMLVHEDDGMMGQFIVVDQSSGIKSSELDQFAIDVYPNPVFEKKVNITSSEPIRSYTLFNSMGILVKEVHLNTPKNNLEINLENYPSGMYFISITRKDGKFTKQLIQF